MPIALPQVVKPEDLALHLGVSERALRAAARKIGACRELGKSMFFLDTDVIMLMEALKSCPSPSTGAAKSGTTGAPSPKSGYQAARERLTGNLLNGSRLNGKRKSGTVISMDRERM
jgi:hypothetical protein